MSEWFVVETNYDHWTPIDTRRKAATVNLNALGAGGVTTESMMELLGKSPTQNKGTVYSVVYVPSDSYANTLVRSDVSADSQQADAEDWMRFASSPFVGFGQE